MSAMEPVTCPHDGCGYTWTPRKEKPKKCPQCQNPLRKVAGPPKRQTSIAPSETAAETPQETDTNTQEVLSDADGVDTYEEAPDGKEQERDEASTPEERLTVEATAEEVTVDPVQLAKERAQQLLRRLNAPND